MPKTAPKQGRGGARKGAGRPTIPAEHRAQNVRLTLDIATIGKARQIGGGNISKGVREAVGQFLIQTIGDSK